MIRLLHTADWHLGQSLMGWSREVEHETALAALLDLAEARAIDALLVVGDVFDTQNPSEKAEALFFRTLVELRRRLPHVAVIVLAGNHDPAGRIEAPRPLLAELGVHVVGRVRRRDGRFDLDRHLIRLAARDGGPDVHVLALPYLGPASLPPIDRRAEEPGSPVARAVAAFHEEAIAAARARIGDAPLVVTGHLAVAGGLESEGAERRILVGGEHALPPELFPADLAYVALGHLHRPQAVGRPTVRYSGSLFPLSATERDYDHGVGLVEIDATGTRIEHVSLPRPVEFRRLPARGAMALSEFDAALAALGVDPTTPLERRPFVQAAIRLDAPAPGLKADLDRIASAHPVRLVGHVVERPALPDAVAEPPPVLDLADIAPEELFARAFAEAHGLAPDARHCDAFADLLETVRHTEG
ncbi:MAG: exonuclease SbcCD subunit D [Hyphomicrobiales bacterium]|nr:exonuclease SbcCD subunit D [Hyphomicrobiales bacterium]